MKKHLFFLTFVLIAATVISQETRQLEWQVLKTDGTINVDGFMSDDEPWGDGVTNLIDQFIPLPAPDPADFDGGTATLLWNDDGLYMYVEIKDNEVVPFPVGEDIRDHWWFYDFIEIYLVRGGDPQYGDSIRTSEGVYTVGTYNCAINAMTSDSTGSDCKNEGQWNYFDFYGKGMEVGWQQTAVGYNAEIFFPWSIFQLDGSNELVPEAAEGAIYGFDFRTNDSDNGEGNNNKHVAMWNNDSGDDNVWNYINYFGTIKLVTELSGINEDYAKTVLNVYPNPVNDVLNIQAKEMQKLSIMNIVGQQVLSMNNVNDQVSIDVSQLNPGIYFVIIENKKGIKGTQRIVVK